MIRCRHHSKYNFFSDHKRTITAPNQWNPKPVKYISRHISSTSNYIIQFPVMEDARAAGKQSGVSKLGIIQFFNFGRTVASVNRAGGPNGRWETKGVSAYSSDDSQGCFKSVKALVTKARRKWVYKSLWRSY